MKINSRDAIGAPRTYRQARRIGTAFPLIFRIGWIVWKCLLCMGDSTSAACLLCRSVQQQEQ